MARHDIPMNLVGTAPVSAKDTGRTEITHPLPERLAESALVHYDPWYRSPQNVTTMRETSRSPESGPRRVGTHAKHTEAGSGVSAT